ncbi:hypothetical protein DEO72_LG3g738 [Vigna unguiculata]|uniref:Uncharacterized protein n=1 Tax=Vigna unguiculata TaxID=3917 RepID=A0A4D6LCV3_VIGUN|nr:hypothetical protein DEO72_LG3g737 [Vigna unguiculata]QCD86217.1 hypothetical protein DEO72_LG3g738 [Vigna unguiculata]
MGFAQAAAPVDLTQAVAAVAADLAQAAATVDTGAELGHDASTSDNFDGGTINLVARFNNGSQSPSGKVQQE